VNRDGLGAQMAVIPKHRRPCGPPWGEGNRRRDAGATTSSERV